MCIRTYLEGSTTWSWLLHRRFEEFAIGQIGRYQNSHVFFLQAFQALDFISGLIKHSSSGQLQIEGNIVD